MDPAELMLEARAIEILDSNSLPNFPPPGLFASRVAARLALFLALDPEALSDPAVLRKPPEGGFPGRTVVVNDPIVALEAVTAGCRVQSVSLPVGINPKAIVDPETVEKVSEILEILMDHLKEELEDFYARDDRYYVWVNSITCPRCGLRIPTIDNPWVISGEYVLKPEVNDGTVSIQVVRTRDLEGGSATVLDSTVVCPSCGERVDVGTAQHELQNALSVTSFLPIGSYLPKDPRRGFRPASYLAAVVTENGRIREIEDDDLKVVRDAFDRLLKWDDPDVRPVTVPSEVHLNERQTLFFLKTVGFLRKLLKESKKSNDRGAADVTALLASVAVGLNSARTRWIPKVAAPGWPVSPDAIPWIYAETVPWALIEDLRGWLEGFLKVLESYPSVRFNDLKNKIDAAVIALPYGRWRPYSEAVRWGLEGRPASVSTRDGEPRERPESVVFVIPDIDALPGALHKLHGLYRRTLHHPRIRAWVLGRSAVLKPVRKGDDDVPGELVRKGRRYRAERITAHAPYTRPITNIPGDLYEAFESIVKEVLRDLDVDPSDPESKLYLVYRYVYGYPKAWEAPRVEEFKALAGAVSLSADKLPCVSLNGRVLLATWRDRNPDDLEGSDDPVDRLHRCLHTMEPPRNGEVLELLRGLCRLPWDHPEVRRAADLLLKDLVGA